MFLAADLWISALRNGTLFKKPGFGKLNGCFLNPAIDIYSVV